VEAEHAGQTDQAVYFLLPFRYDAFGRTRVWAEYRAGSHTLIVLGVNETCTVLTNRPHRNWSVSRNVMKALGLSKPKVTVAAMSIAHVWQQSGKKWGHH